MFLIKIYEKTGRFYYYLFNHFSSGQEKLELGIRCFHPQIMKNIYQNVRRIMYVVSKATSSYIVFCLINTFLFILVLTAIRINTGNSGIAILHCWV